VPSKTLAKVVKDSHSKWLKTPGKKGQIHKDTDMRKFEDIKGEYLEKWDLLN